jgi:type VI secretion system VasD/TssJ family lipoprotein
VNDLRVGVAAVLVAVAATGCGGPLILRFQGTEPLNVNAVGESTPVDVRVFLLKDSGSFTKAPFEQLWGDKYKQVLGADVVGEPREDTIYAGNAKKMDLGEIPKEVRFIGIMAKYGKQDEAKSERHFAVAKEDADDFLYELTGYKILRKK